MALVKELQNDQYHVVSLDDGRDMFDELNRSSSSFSTGSNGSRHSHSHNSGTRGGLYWKKWINSRKNIARTGQRWKACLANVLKSSVTMVEKFSFEIRDDDVLIIPKVGLCLHKIDDDGDVDDGDGCDYDGYDGYEPFIFVRTLGTNTDTFSVTPVAPFSTRTQAIDHPSLSHGEPTQLQHFTFRSL